MSLAYLLTGLKERRFGLGVFYDRTIFFPQVDLTRNHAYPSPENGILAKHTPYIALRDYTRPLQPRPRFSPSQRQRKCLRSSFQRRDHRNSGIHHDHGLPRKGHRRRREASARRAFAPPSGGWWRSPRPDPESVGVPVGVGEQDKTS